MGFGNKLLALIFSFLCGWATSQEVQKAETTIELRNALHDHKVKRVELVESVTVGREEWGDVIPQIERKVIVTPSESQKDGNLAIYLKGLTTAVVVGSKGTLVFEGITIFNAIDSGKDAPIEAFPNIVVYDGGLITARACNLVVTPIICDTVPFGGGITVAEMWHMAYTIKRKQAADPCGMEHHTDHSAYFAGSENCGFDTIVVPADGNGGDGVFTMEDTYVLCAIGTADNQKEVEYITEDAETAVDLAYVFARASRMDNVKASVNVLNDITIEEDVWPYMLLFPNTQGIHLSIQGDPKSRPVIQVSEANDGQIISLGLTHTASLEDVVLQMPKFSSLIMKSRVCQGFQADVITEMPVLMPNIIHPHDGGLNITLRNTRATYDRCPHFFSPLAFCSSLEDFLLTHINAEATVMDITCSAQDPNSIIFTRIHAVIPVLLGNGNVYHKWTIDATNYIVECKEFGLKVDCDQDWGVAEAHTIEQDVAIPIKKKKKNGARGRINLVLLLMVLIVWVFVI